jgi:hypothetical protein
MQTLNPSWDQTFLVSGAQGDTTWAFTVVDSDEQSSRDEYLGQVGRQVACRCM